MHAIRLTSLTLACLLAGVAASSAQPRPPERRERTEVEARAERARSEAAGRRTEKADKWDSNQQRDKFNDAASPTGRAETRRGTSERESEKREEQRARSVERRADKADKWASNQQRDKFNNAASGRTPERSNGTGSNTSTSAAGEGGAAAPPAAPSGARPPRPAGPRP